MPAGSLDLPRHRDLAGRGAHPWVRRAVLLAFLAVAVVALAGVIGQRARRTAIGAPAARLEVSAPARARGGLYFQALITVRARRTIQNPQLVLNRGWFDGLTINTLEPDPSQQGNTGNGGVTLSYDKLSAGDTLRVFIEYQVNPTTVSHRSQVVELDDGATKIAAIRHHLTIFP
jgi:hypothetical protein